MAFFQFWYNVLTWPCKPHANDATANPLGTCCIVTFQIEDIGADEQMSRNQPFQRRPQQLAGRKYECNNKWAANEPCSYSAKDKPWYCSMGQVSREVVPDTGTAGVS